MLSNQWFERKAAMGRRILPQPRRACIGPV
jgi:hypothetical protein